MKNRLSLMMILLMAGLFASTSTEAQSTESQSFNFDEKTTSLCKQIAEGATGTTKLNVAVIEFQNLNGKSSDFSRFLCEELTTKLFQTKKFNIVERSQIDKIAKEQKLQLTGPIDEESIKKLGKLLGVDAILTGTITDIQSTIRINARLISATTASIYSVASANVNKDEMILSLLNLPSAQSQGANQLNFEERTTGSPKPSNDVEFSGGAGSIERISGFIFEFKNMKVGPAGHTTCEVLITSTGEDALLYVGDTYGIKTTRVMSRSGRAQPAQFIYVESSRSNSSYLKYKFLKGVPTLVTLLFPRSEDGIDSLYLLNIHIQAGPNDKTGSEVRLKIQQ